MAKISLTLNKVVCYGTTTKNDNEGTSNVTISSDVDTASVWFKVDSDIKPYNLTLVNVNFLKKMYQPTEVNAEIHLELADNSKWASVSKSTLETAFKYVQVELKCDDDDDKIVGDDYYVHEVQAIYHQSSMHINLKIYSLDKLLTLRQASRAFVAKKLGADILENEIKNFIKPWTIKVPQTLLDKQNELLKKVKDLSDSKLKKLSSYFYKIFSTQSGCSVTDFPDEFASIITLTTEWKKEKVKQKLYQKPLTCSTSHMQVLKYSGTSEHIHPYLVQYNESFYDFLARTANRWGEFMYYEDGNLNIGYDKNNTGSVGTYADRYYFNIYDVNQKKDLSVSKAGNYDVQASNEDQFIKNTLKKSPNEISGIMYCPNGKFDKVVMKKFAEFFKNDQSLPAFIVNQVVDDTIEVGSRAVKRDHANEKFDEKYFTGSKIPGKPEQYGTHNFGTKEEPENKQGFNQFTELHTGYNDSKYKEILSKEQVASHNALFINYETNYPNLKLGQIITVDNENYIVVEVACKKKSSVDYTLEEDKDKDPKEYKLKKTITSNYVFNVVALAQDGTNEKVFYPTVIPTGHIRQAEPQMATITDASDPSDNNQVRVVFPWQYEPFDETNKEAIYRFMDKYPSLNPAKPDDAADDATPWLKFTTNASGSPVVGKHYAGNKVLVGFIDGNVERPYVLGGLEAKGDSGADVIQTTPGGHALKINDDPSGVSKFLTGMFLPGWKSLSAFVPQMGELPETEGDTGVKLGGGFELTDNYGIYKISGSTDGRNVTVASPWGNVAINAFTGITISAPNGDVRIKGKNVSIEAGNNLTLTSGTNVRAKIIDGNSTLSNLGGEIATAVAKKLADVFLNGLLSVDLTVVRDVFDIVFRPVEGKLLVKSNRYLMLESGKGECSYPTDAYVDSATAENLIAKRKEADFREGIELSSEVVSVVTLIGNLVDKYNDAFIKSYNDCVTAKDDFIKAIKACWMWTDDYNKNNKPEPVFCKSFENLKPNFWADNTDAFSQDWLDYQGNFKSDSVDDVVNILQRYADDKGKDLTDPTVNQDEVKQQALELRRHLKYELFFRGSALRNRIMTYLSYTNGLSEKEIKKAVERESIKTKNMPDLFIKALVKAFSKDKIGDDSFYYDSNQNLDDDLKNVSAPFAPAHFDNQKKFLKRKASIVWLEEIGFKDEAGWRKEIAKRDAHGVPVDTEDALGNPIEGSTEIPVKVSEFGDVIDANKWEDYLNSLRAVPKISPVKYKALEALKKSGAKWVDNINVFKNINENKSWGNAKNGGILFSSDVHTYGLDKGKSLNTIAKENLTELDDQAFGVTSFLDAIRNVMKTY